MLALRIGAAKALPLLHPSPNEAVQKTIIATGAIEKISKPLLSSFGPTPRNITPGRFFMCDKKHHLYNVNSQFFPIYVPIARLYLHGSGILGIRSYNVPGPESTPSPPSKISPQKEQVERAFFRCVAFAWDFGCLVFIWSRKLMKIYVTDNPTVIHYSKRFLAKMEEAKKDT